MPKCSVPLMSHTMKKTNNRVDIYYQNARGLRTKASEFFANVLSSNFPIIVISESWLCSDISSNDYFPPNYQVFRKDRNFTGAKQKGGGVLVAVDCGLQCKRRQDLEGDNECVWLDIRLTGGERLLIGAFYIPPDVPISSFNELLTSVEEVCASHQNHHFIILGDFNAPGVQWDSLTNQHYNYYVQQKSRIVLDFLDFTSMTQLNNIKNCSENILDLCFSNIQNARVSMVDISLVKPDKLHPPFSVSAPVSIRHCGTSLKYNELSPFCYARGDYIGLYSFFSSFDWSEIQELPDCNAQVERFTEIVKSGMDQFIPKYKPNHSKHPHWFSKELRTTLKLKDRCHRKYKKTGSDEWKQNFCSYRKLCKNLYERDQRSYLDSVESSANSQPETFWRYIRSRKNNSHDLINLVDSSGEEVHNVANHFAQHFSATCGQRDVSEMNILLNRVQGSSLVLLDEQLVLESLKRMKPSLSCGADGIPPAILKTYGSIFVPVLTVIFNQCLKTNVFPLAWKISRVRPIFKSGSKSDATNYRAVSLLCACSKLFETALYKLLSSSVQNLLVSKQHGFISGRSTTTNLSCFMEQASAAISERGQLDVVYCDLSKAFDVVCHTLLLKKLLQVGIDTPLVALLGSYLDNRFSFVSVNGQTSALYRSTSGVPQGSVLGPLLFSIFVNDVSAAIKMSSFLLYADDIKIFRRIESINDCIALEQDISSFSKWCSDNRLNLNSTKTKVMSYSRKTNRTLFCYSINGGYLSRVEEIRDLGVLFDSALTFSPHVTQLTRRALRSLGAVCRFSREFRFPSSFLKLFRTLCIPQLEYASVVWNGTCSSNCQRIERVQTKFSSIFRHRFPSEPIPITVSLSSRRTHSDLLFMYKLLHGIILCPELLESISFRVPQKATRLAHPFKAAGALSTRSPLQRMQHLHNVHSEKLDIFQRPLREFLAGLSALTH